MDDFFILWEYYGIAVKGFPSKPWMCLLALLLLAMWLWAPSGCDVNISCAIGGTAWSSQQPLGPVVLSTSHCSYRIWSSEQCIAAEEPTFLCRPLSFSSLFLCFLLSKCHLSLEVCSNATSPKNSASGVELISASSKPHSVLLVSLSRCILTWAIVGKKGPTQGHNTLQSVTKDIERSKVKNAQSVKEGKFPPCFSHQRVITSHATF